MRLQASVNFLQMDASAGSGARDHAAAERSQQALLVLGAVLRESALRQVGERDVRNRTGELAPASSASREPLALSLLGDALLPDGALLEVSASEQAAKKKKKEKKKKKKKNMRLAKAIEKRKNKNKGKKKKKRNVGELMVRARSRQRRASPAAAQTNQPPPHPRPLGTSRTESASTSSRRASRTPMWCA